MSGSIWYVYIRLSIIGLQTNHNAYIGCIYKCCTWYFHSQLGFLSPFYALYVVKCAASCLYSMAARISLCDSFLWVHSKAAIHVFIVVCMIERALALSSFLFLPPYVIYVHGEFNRKITSEKYKNQNVTIFHWSNNNTKTQYPFCHWQIIQTQRIVYLWFFFV